MYTTFGLEELQRQIANRNDDGAMQSVCGEYNCDCHDLVPKLVDDLVKLHKALGEIKGLTEPLPIKALER